MQHSDVHISLHGNMLVIYALLVPCMSSCEFIFLGLSSQDGTFGANAPSALHNKTLKLSNRRIAYNNREITHTSV